MSNEIKQLKRACHNSRVLETLGSAYPWEDLLVTMTKPPSIGNLHLHFLLQCHCAYLLQEEPMHCLSQSSISTWTNSSFIILLYYSGWENKPIYIIFLKALKGRPIYSDITTQGGSIYSDITTQFWQIWQFIVGTYFDWYYDRSYKKGRLLISVHYFMKSEKKREGRQNIMKTNVFQNFVVSKVSF